MRCALMREVSRSLGECQLTFQTREPIDVDLAQAQHGAYVQLLRRHGFTVLRAPAGHALPDAVFVEDALLVLDEVAIALVPGAPARRAEVDSLLAIIGEFREIERMDLPATADGGDIVQIGRRLFVGRSARTNDAGISRLAAIAGRFGYTVTAVPVAGCLHLKTACTSLGDRVLLNPRFVDTAAFAPYHPLHVPVAEPQAADVLRLPDVVVVARGFPRTAALLERHGYRVEPVDVSEFQKAEAGVTCLSILFEAAALPARLVPLEVTR